MPISSLDATQCTTFAWFFPSGDGVQVSLLPFTSCVTLDELFDDSVPWLPHLCSGDDNDIDLIRLPRGLDI